MSNFSDKNPPAPPGRVNVAWQSSGNDISANVLSPVEGGITSLTGDVTASGPGSAAASVVKVNGAVIPLSQSSLASNASGQIVAGLASGYNPLSFNWYGRTFAGTALTGSSSNSINFGSGVCPAGISGLNVGETIYITDTGTPANSEVVAITGGTARPGVAGGTLTFDCVHSHSAGAWSLGSASMGIQEVSFAALTAAYNISGPLIGGHGTTVHLSGEYDILGDVFIPKVTTGVGSQWGLSFIGDGSALLAAQSNGLHLFDANCTCQFDNIVFSGASMVSGSAAIRFGNANYVGGPSVKNCIFNNFYDCIVGVDCQRIQSSLNFANSFTHCFIVGNCSSFKDSCVLESVHDTTFCMGLGSPAYASVYYTSGWVKITNPSFGSSLGNDQIQYGVKGYITFSTSATSIVGGEIAYYSTAGFSLTVSGSGVFYQYVTISGVNIHGENTNIANKGIEFIVTGGAITIKQVTIGSNTIQGGGSNATGIDVTGCTDVTIGPDSNNITLVGTRIVGYAGPPAYANNAAAISAGLCVGEVYRISSADTMGVVH